MAIGSEHFIVEPSRRHRYPIRVQNTFRGERLYIEGAGEGLLLTDVRVGNQAHVEMLHPLAALPFSIVNEVGGEKVWGERFDFNTAEVGHDILFELWNTSDRAYNIQLTIFGTSR